MLIMRNKRTMITTKNGDVNDLGFEMEKDTDMMTDSIDEADYDHEQMSNMEDDGEEVSMNHTDNELSMDTPDQDGMKTNDDTNNDSSDQAKDNVEVPVVFEEANDVTESDIHDSVNNDDDDLDEQDEFENVENDVEDVGTDAHFRFNVDLSFCDFNKEVQNDYSSRQESAEEHDDTVEDNHREVNMGYVKLATDYNYFNNEETAEKLGSFFKYDKSKVNDKSGSMTEGANLFGGCSDSEVDMLHFWLTAFQNANETILGELVEQTDHKMLKYLTDITVALFELLNTGFTLNSYSITNLFFINEQVWGRLELAKNICSWIAGTSQLDCIAKLHDIFLALSEARVETENCAQAVEDLYSFMEKRKDKPLNQYSHFDPGGGGRGAFDRLGSIGTKGRMEDTLRTITGGRGSSGVDLNLAVDKRRTSAQFGETSQV